jgi:hypothetical protein
MPLQVNESLPTKFETPNYLTLSSQKKGVISLIDKSLLPKDALEIADNIFLYEEGQAGLRPGIDWFGAVSPNGLEIDGFDYFDFEGVVHLVMVAGGVVYRSTDNADTWTECTGGTLTAGAVVEMNQANSLLHMTTGLDNAIRYNGSTTIITEVALTTPAAPTRVAGGGLTGTGYSFYYQVAAVNLTGFSEASPESTVLQTSFDRSTWDSTTKFATITVPAFQATQTRADIYISSDNLNYYYIASTYATGDTWKDDGTAIPVPSTTAPTSNTSQGIKAAELTNVGSRMYGVRDPDNRYRIWFSSAEQGYLGAFASGYGGGYLDWQEGGKFIPTKVEDYRDGKNTPVATVWCSSADGQGCILQMSIEELTIGDITVFVPSAYKLPGSRGTPSPGSVVNVLNDYMFYNSQAFYNLGSRAQFLNLLSTDETSANVRPDVKKITQAGESGIASVYFDARVYFSVPVGTSSNNRTMIYDTERKAWLPTAFTVGFKRFLRYTDTAGAPRLLCMKPGDTRLSEIGANIRGDYGIAFNSVLQTGLYPTLRNRFEFQWTEQAEFELSNPNGEISVELIGIQRSKGFSSQGLATVQAQLTNTGWDSAAWDTALWDDTSVVIDIFSESSVKRYFRLGKELNAIQWRITTDTLDAGYILRTLQTWGTETRAGLPRSWKVPLV